MKSDSTGEDRRVYDRFTARFPVKIKDADDDFGTRIYMRDASASGSRLTSRDRFFINDSLSIEVKLPDGQDPLVLNGHVRWVRPGQGKVWDFGLEFHKIHFMKLQRLFKFCE